MSHTPAEYALSEAEHERIFQTYVVGDYFGLDLTPSPQPTAVILGGQPGAGKTALLVPAETDLRAIGSTVVINGDDLRVFHPDYRTWQTSDPEYAAQFTNLDSGRWVEKLIAAGAERQVNLVIESTMRNPDVFASTSQKLRDAGYSVEARAMAVNERASWQGVHVRYEGMIKNNAAPRFTVAEAHDAGVTGMLKTLQRIEDEQLADRVLIGRRGGSVLYDNYTENGQWKNPPDAVQVVVAERNRVQTRDEIEEFSARWLSVIAKMDSRSAGEARVAAVEKVAIEDTAHFRKQRLQGGNAETVTDRTRREIINRKPDQVRLYDELYKNAVRDASMRPLGNLEVHAQGRLSQSYTALKLIEAARDNGALPEGATIVATGAKVQDKQTSREFPAAHRLPADLSVKAVDGSQFRLTEHFGVELNRTIIDRDVFAPTDRVSRIANVADSWVEQGGMKTALVSAGNAVAAGRMSADVAMTRVIEPGYAAAIANARDKIDRNFSYAERSSINHAIVNADGRPVREVAEDLRLRTENLEVRAQAKAMMAQTFDVYSRHVHLSQEDRIWAAVFVHSIAENERTLPVSDTTLIAAERLPDLSPAEISARAENSDRAAAKRSEIENLSRLVYGNTLAVSTVIQTINQNPDLSSGAANMVRTSPEQIAPLAGEPAGWIKSASPERQTAEAHAPQLAAALQDYGPILAYEKGWVVEAHRSEQNRLAQQVPAPSPQLSATLRSPVAAQKIRFDAFPGTRSEMNRLSVALDKRLAPHDHKALRTGDIATAARSMNTTATQVKQIAQVKNQVNDASKQIQAQQREIVKTQDTALKITR